MFSCPHHANLQVLYGSSAQHCGCMAPPQVLIFSQFKIMLDVLEDMMAMMAMPVERVDGSIRGRDRQSAIDRYQAGEQ